MKKVLLVLSVLGSFNIFAQEKPAVGESDSSTVDCTKIFAGKGQVKGPTTTEPAPVTKSEDKRQ